MNLFTKVKNFALKPFKEKVTKPEESNSFKDVNTIHLNSNINHPYKVYNSKELYSNTQNTTHCSNCKRSFVINTSDHNNHSIEKCYLHDQYECPCKNKIKSSPILRSSRSDGAIHRHYNDDNHHYRSIRNIYNEPELSQSSSSLSTFDLDLDNSNIDKNFNEYYHHHPTPHPHYQPYEGNNHHNEHIRRRRYSSFTPSLSSLHPSQFPFFYAPPPPPSLLPPPPPPPLLLPPLPPLPPFSSSIQQKSRHLNKKVSFSDQLCEINQHSTYSSSSSASTLPHDPDLQSCNSSNVIKMDNSCQHSIQKNSSYYRYDHDHQYHQQQHHHFHKNNNNNYNYNNNGGVLYPKSIPSSSPYYLITNKPHEHIPKSMDMNAKKVSKYLSTKKFRDKKQWNDEEEQNKMNQIFNHHQDRGTTSYDIDYISQYLKKYQDKGKGRKMGNFLNL